GWLLLLTAKSAAADLEASGADIAFLEGKILSARHYGQERLSLSPALAGRIMAGGDGAADASADHFARR
ncbi:MAG: acyl-CoA dehydrogenase C-terminal domain-containing protein, partial [Rhodospirillaceae bacterium]|nr:acyl-CoA dehydrogenase C-terminal domain-containing protein [Rhodospirillaceae bacterium]